MSKIKEILEDPGHQNRAALVKILESWPKSMRPSSHYRALSLAQKSLSEYTLKQLARWIDE